MILVRVRDVADFLVELSAGVIVMALGGIGCGAERSIGFLTLADGDKY